MPTDFEGGLTRERHARSGAHYLHYHGAVPSYYIAFTCETSVLITRADDLRVGQVRKSVMVIDDNAELRAMLSELLYAQGYMVYSAEDATNAYDIASVMRPSVVLCDVCLPTTNGFQAAAQLQEHSETRRIPVILMSGRSYLRDDRPATERWLLKPFTNADLTAAIEEAAP
ncbi:MAG TPA: response regulator [Candidatus Limnocylindria bacterium]|nr:response regulator [Candidatus Limnocylindria bacterium]